jgi:hypothetical protein
MSSREAGRDRFRTTDPREAVPQTAQGIVANAQAQKDPLAALRALNDGYAKAPQNV